jgi:hypothetical protein
MNKPNITPDPTQVKDTQEGETSDFYALIRRDICNNPKIGNNAFRVYAALDTHGLGKGVHVYRETMLKVSYPFSMASLDRGLKELVDLGYLVKLRHRGCNYYVLSNPRSQFKSSNMQSSKSSNMRSLNRSNIKEIKSKSTEEPKSPKTSAAKTPAAASANPFMTLTSQDQGYLRAFSDAFRESSESLYIDVKALSRTSIKALLKAKEDDLLSADDLATMCANWLNYQIEKRALTGKSPIYDLVGFLVKALPAIVDGEGHSVKKVLKTSYLSVNEVTSLIACDCGNLVTRLSEGNWTGCRRCTPYDPRYLKIGVIEGLERQWRHSQDPNYLEPKEETIKEVKELARLLGRGI